MLESDPPVILPLSILWQCSVLQNAALPTVWVVSSPALPFRASLQVPQCLAPFGLTFFWDLIPLGIAQVGVGLLTCYGHAMYLKVMWVPQKSSHVVGNAETPAEHTYVHCQLLKRCCWPRVWPAAL